MALLQPSGSAGDVNGDGFSDVIVGAPSFDGGRQDAGRVFLFLGSASGLSSTPDWTADGPQALCVLGWAVSCAGDVNGDGYSDIIVGASCVTTAEHWEGRAYLYYGTPSGVSDSPAWIADGNRAEQRFGYWVSTAGDVDSDGFDDVIVGCCCFGGTRVFHGSSSGLSSSAAWEVGAGTRPGEYDGPVATAGDANGDGFAEVVIGSMYGDSSGGGGAPGGRVWLYEGSASGLSGTPDWEALGDQDFAAFGQPSASAGDVNGDGLSDLIVGAPFYDTPSDNAGRVYLFYGALDDPVPDNLIRLRQFQADAVSALPFGRHAVSRTIVFKAIPRSAGSPGAPRRALEVEFKPIGTPFDSLSNVATGPYVAPGEVSFAVAGGLAPGAYHWRGRLRLEGSPSPGRWFAAGLNLEGDADFRVGDTFLPSPSMSNLGQWRSDGVTPIPPGGAIGDATMAIRADLFDPSARDVRLQVELRPASVGFIDVPTAESNIVTSGSQVLLSLSAVPDDAYHWQARAVNASGLASGWVPFGGAPDDDFTIDTTSPVVDSISVSPDRGTVPLTVQFTVSATDAGALTYYWDFDGDHVWEETTTAPVVQHTYTSHGHFETRVRTSDTPGNFGCATIWVEVFPPPSISNLSQRRSDAVTLIPPGECLDEDTVVFQAEISDPQREQLRLQVEVRPMGEPFANLPNAESLFVPSESRASVTVASLPEGPYHWQARTCNSAGEASDWIPYACGSSADFIVDTVAPVIDSISASPSRGTVPLLVGFDASVVEANLVACEWDFQDDGTTDSTSSAGPAAEFRYDRRGTYTARLVVRDCAANTTSATVQVEVTSPPASSELQQFHPDGTTPIEPGACIDSDTVVLSAVMSEPTGEDVSLQVELLSGSGPFTGAPTAVSPFVGSGTRASVVISGLLDAPYRWRARAVDASGEVSAIDPGSNQRSLQGPYPLTPVLENGDVDEDRRSPSNQTSLVLSCEEWTAQVACETRVELPLGSFAGQSASLTAFTPSGGEVPPCSPRLEYVQFRSLSLQQQGQETVLLKPVRIRIYYPDSDGDGLVDGTVVSEKALTMYRYQADQWVPVQTTQLHWNDNWLEGLSSTLRVFALAAPGESGPEELVFGLGSSGGGWLQCFDDSVAACAPVRWLRLPWNRYNSAGGETRPASGDLDGDGLAELVIGLENGSEGWLAVLDDGEQGYPLLRWLRIPWQAYTRSAGGTWPACGDLDGDRRDELVVGLDAYPANGGWFCLFEDALSSLAFQSWRRLPWTAYNRWSGEIRPACGDLDGDGVEELVLGLASYPMRGGWLAIFESAESGVVPMGWIRLPWGRYNNEQGETRPACGDLDHDGRAELAIGLGSYPQAGGWLAILDDAAMSYRTIRWWRLPWDAYNERSGELRPAVGNVDGEGAAELLVGLGSGGEGRFAVLGGGQELCVLRLWGRIRWSSYNQRNGETFPALGDQLAE